MKNMFILCGEAFSGKSTLAKEIAKKYDAKIVGIDQVYFATAGILALEDTPYEDDTSLWRNLWAVVLQGIKNHLLLGNSVVVDDNCFRRSRRDELRALAQNLNIKTILIYLDVPTEILRQRKKQNKISKERHDVPSAWMLEDSIKFDRPTADEDPVIYQSDTSLEDFLVELEQKLS